MPTRTAMLALLFVGAVACGSGGTALVVPGGAQAADHGGVDGPAPAGGWLVVHVVDGDTLDVRDAAGAEERVRLIGIDTPERGECGHDPAADLLARLALGRPVSLIAGAREDRDTYGRLLRYVHVQGQDAGLALVRAGLGIARYDSRDGYGAHAREAAYVRADAAASSPVCPPGP